MLLGTAVAAAGTAALGSLAWTGHRSQNAIPAAGALAQPTVHDRAAWNARPPTSPAQVLAAAPTYIVVHHTATANTTDYSQAAAFSLSRGIQNHHMDTNGWADTGQQLTISRGGYVMEGRNTSLSAINAGDHVVGAHVANFNSVAVGIENEGTYTSASPTDALYDSLVETCAWLCAVYGRPTDAIIGHRDLNATACPGDVLYGMLPQLRSDVGGLLRDPGLVRRRLTSAEEPPSPEVPVDEPAETHEHGPALCADDPHADEG
jgi:hypothetical protein